MTDECLICAKHQGRGPLAGPLVFADEHCLVFHRGGGDDGTTLLGHLFVESRRHVPYLADLTDAEAETIGRVVRRAAHALRSELDAEYVFSAVVGTGVAHFHQHVFARHRGTPAEVPWHDSNDWADAPRAAPDELVERLRPYFARR